MKITQIVSCLELMANLFIFTGLPVRPVIKWAFGRLRRKTASRGREDMRVWYRGTMFSQMVSYDYWAACAPSHKMGFRSSVAKSGLPGEGRHEGLVPRNDVLTNGFI